MIGDLEEAPNKTIGGSEKENEYNSLIKIETWNLVDLPDGRKHVSCGWISKVKKYIDRTDDEFYMDNQKGLKMESMNLPKVSIDWSRSQKNITQNSVIFWFEFVTISHEYSSKIKLRKFWLPCMWTTDGLVVEQDVINMSKMWIHWYVQNH